MQLDLQEPLATLEQGLVITNLTDNTNNSATGTIIISSSGNNVVSANGYSATNGTNTIVSDASIPRIIVGNGSNSCATTNGSMTLNTSGAGYTNTFQIALQNNNSTVGATTGVSSISYYKAGRNAATSDVIGSEHYYAKNSAGTKVEFARVEAQARSTTAGLESGYWGVNVSLSGVMTNFLNCNSNTNSINVAKNIDMNGQLLKTSSSNITIDASTSSGVGSIIQTLKAGANLIINNLPTSSVGLPSNAVWRNGNVLNIV